MSRNILLILADARDAQEVTAWLARSDEGVFEVESAGTCHDGIERLVNPTRTAIDAVLLDLSLPDSDGIETFDKVFAAAPHLPILVMVRIRDELVAREAVRHGASDFLLKGRFDRVSLSKAVGAMLERTARPVAQVIEQERAQVTLDSIGDAVVSTDAAGNVTYLNPKAESMTGWSGQQATGRSLQEVLRIVNADTRQTVLNPLTLAMKEDRSVTLGPNSLLLSRDGREIAIEDTASPIHDTHGLMTGAVIVFKDVGEARTRELKLSHMAQHDALTGLPNRLLLDDRLSQAIAMASRHRKSLAVLFMDVDGLKQVNDSQGHPAGDEMLKGVGLRLLASVRAVDTVSRIGGDEFVALLTEVGSPADAALCAAKMLAVVGESLEIDGRELNVSMSVGIAIFPRDGKDAETLMRNADSALLHAKAHGRGRYQLFEPDKGRLGDAHPRPASAPLRAASVA